VNLPLRLGFAGSELTPGTGDDVGCRPPGLPQKVHRDHAELQPRATLHEEHRVIVRDLQQLAQVGLGGLDNGLERWRTVTDLQDRHAQSRQGQQITLRLLQSGKR